MRKKFLFIFFLLLISSSKILAQWQLENQLCGLTLRDTSESMQVGTQGTAALKLIAPTGALRILVVMCKFKNDTYELSPNTDLWPSNQNSMPAWANDFLTPDKRITYPNPSFSGFYKVMSNSKLDLYGDEVFYQPLLPDSMYFIRKGKHIGYLVEEILRGIDPYVDFRNYDNDKDGTVDMIMICFRFANTTELDGSKYQGICGLTGNMGSFINPGPLALDGVNILPDVWGSGIFQQNIISIYDAIRCAAHEFGHYLWGGVHYVGEGYHGIMDGAGSGVVSSFERILMGWIKPQIIPTNEIGISIGDAIQDTAIYRINAPGRSDYFLIENHKGLNYYENSFLQYNGGPLVSPGTGILISHVSSGSPTLDVESAFGRWNWKKDVSGLYIFPFENSSVNRISGEDKLILPPQSTRSVKIYFPLHQLKFLRRLVA